MDEDTDTTLEPVKTESDSERNEKRLRELERLLQILRVVVPPKRVMN